MQVGRPWWRCVTIDSAGVPKGGRFGRVAWFAEQVKRYGLTLCWSRLHGCFGLMSRRAPGKWTWHMHFRQGGVGSDITPLTREVLGLILWMRRQTKGRTVAETQGMLAQIEADEKARVQAEYDELGEHTTQEAVEETWLERGYRTPIVMPLPKKVELYPRAARRRAQRARRKLIVTPGEVN